MSEQLSQPDDRGLWRFGIISPLLHRAPGDTTLQERINELAQRIYFTPDGKEKQLCPATLRSWLDRYRTGGIDALRNKQRKDGGLTSVPLSLQHALADLRKEQPDWTIKRMLKQARKQGQWDGQKPSRSALYRFTSAHHLKRSADAPATQVRSFEFPCFGDLWSADFLHGPKIRQGTRVCKTYLHTIIDDATRYVVAARFHLAEDTRALLDDLMLAIRRFGIPKRFYTDNGAAFRSNHLRLVAAKLGISLPHTPPYMPRGRGKIERFFRSVRDGLITGRQRTSLDKLNADLAAWINQYHQTPHRMLGMSPLDRKLTDTAPALKQISATQNIDEIFRMQQVKRVGSDGCIRLFNKRFEVPGAIPRSQLTVSYLPWNQEYILIGPDMRIVKPLDTTKNALRFDKPRRGGAAHTPEVGQ